MTDYIEETPKTAETLIEWADKIDRRLGPISGTDADELARLLRSTAARIKQLTDDERARCVAIVQAAREGEIDNDLRTIIYLIKTGEPIEEILEESE